MVPHDLGANEGKDVAEVLLFVGKPPLQGTRRDREQRGDSRQGDATARELRGNQVFHLPAKIGGPAILLAGQMSFEESRRLLAALRQASMEVRAADEEAVPMGSETDRAPEVTAMLRHRWRRPMRELDPHRIPTRTEQRSSVADAQGDDRLDILVRLRPQRRVDRA